MKKSLFIMLGLTMLVGKLSAQLTLDHTFSGYISGSFPFIEEPIGHYCSSITLDNTNTIYLYNSNYSLYKTISLNYPSGYSHVYTYILGKHLVNVDDKVEFFVSATNPDASFNNRGFAMIVNEDGSVIQDFGYSFSVSYLGGIYKAGNQLRFSIIKGEYNEQSYQTSYLTEVYICHGNYTAVTSFENENTAMQPFPNPTATLINLPYHIEKGTVSTINIYNIGGQLIETYNIGGDFEMITIDVNNYAKGIYVYEYNGISNRFVVE